MRIFKGVLAAGIVCAAFAFFSCSEHGGDDYDAPVVAPPNWREVPSDTPAKAVYPKKYNEFDSEPGITLPSDSVPVEDTGNGYSYNLGVAGSADDSGLALSSFVVGKSGLSQAPQLYPPDRYGQWLMNIPRDAPSVTLSATAEDASVEIFVPETGLQAKDALTIPLNNTGATYAKIIVTQNTPEEVAYIEGGDLEEPPFYPSRIYMFRLDKGILEPVVNDQPEWSSIYSGPGFSDKIYLKDIDWDDLRLWVFTWVESKSKTWIQAANRHVGGQALTWCYKKEETPEPYIQFYYTVKTFYNERAKQQQDHHQYIMFIYTGETAYALLTFDYYPSEEGNSSSEGVGWVPPGGGWTRGDLNDFHAEDHYGLWMNLIVNGSLGEAVGRVYKDPPDMFAQIDPSLKPLEASRLAYVRNLRVCYENLDSKGEYFDGSKSKPELERVIDGVPVLNGPGLIQHNVYALRVPSFADRVTITPTSLLCYQRDVDVQRLPDYERFKVYNAEGPDTKTHVRPYNGSAHTNGFFYRHDWGDGEGGVYGAWDVKLEPGETKRVDIVITSDDGLHKNTYYVYVTRRIKNPLASMNYNWAQRFNNTTLYMNYTDGETGERVDTRLKPLATKPDYDGWKYYDLDDVMLVHKAKESLFSDNGKGVNVVFMGDGFSQDQSVQGGVWETAALDAARAFLDTAVVRDYADHINIWIMFNPCLGEGGVDGFSGPKNRWGTATPNGNVTFDSYGIRNYLKGLFGGDNFIVAFKANGKFGSWSMGWLCSGGYNDGYAAKHEFIGHTLANMVDEYGGGTSSDGVSSKPMEEEANPEFKYPYDFDGICTNGIWNTTARDFRKHVKPPEGDTTSAWAQTYANANDPNRKYYYFDPNGDKWNNWTGKQIVSQDIDLNPDWADKSSAWRTWLKEMYLPPWKDFMDHPEFVTKREYKAPPGYEDAMVGIYEGGAVHARGHYRSTPDSVMNSHQTYFTPWQRYILWAKIQYRSEAKKLSDFQMFDLDNPFEGKFVKPAALKAFLRYDTVNTGRSVAEIDAWWNEYGKHLPDESKLKAPK